jgi:putative chitinase
MITRDQLQGIMPNADSEAWTDVLNDAMARHAISNPRREAAFLAQIAVESRELRTLVENLNYSAQRLTAVWPKRFPSLAAAAPYEHNPERLASRVYANRLGNGDEVSGDGWRFRGRGLIQVTGRDNYRRVGQALALPLEAQPELLEQPQPAALSAASFWQSRGLNELADDCTDDGRFVAICEAVNGGDAGLDERRAHWASAKRALGIA